MNAASFVAVAFAGAVFVAYATRDGPPLPATTPYQTALEQQRIIDTCRDARVALQDLARERKALLAYHFVPPTPELAPQWNALASHCGQVNQGR